MKRITKRTLLTLCCVLTSPALFSLEPYLGISINANKAQAARNESIPIEIQEYTKDWPLGSTLNALEHTHLDLLFYPDEAPVFIVLNGQTHAIKIAEEGILKNLLVKDGDGYKWDPDRPVPEAYGSYPLDSYQLAFKDGHAVLAPSALMSKFLAGTLPLHTAVSGDSGTIKIDDYLATFTLNYQQNATTNLTEKGENLSFSELTKENLKARLESPLIDNIFNPLQQAKHLEMGFRLSGPQTRNLVYSETFRDAATGQKFFQQLRAIEKTERLAGRGLVGHLTAALHKEKVQPTLTYTNNTLQLSTTWKKEQDDSIRDNITESYMAAVTSAYDRPPNIEASKGDIETIYDSGPARYAKPMDAETFKQQVAKAMPQRFFNRYYRDGATNPKMGLSFDGEHIPNLGLYNISHIITGVKSIDGTSIWRETESQKGRIYQGQGPIYFPITDGIPMEKFGHGEVEYTFTGPEKVLVFDLSTEGERRTDGEIQIELTRMEKDIAQVTYHGTKAIEFHAFDHTGKLLECNDFMQGDHYQCRRFFGVIKTIRVIVKIGETTFTLPFKIDLDQGKQAAPPTEATTDIRPRYTYPKQASFAYQDPDPAVLDALTVVWEAPEHELQQGKLAIQLQKKGLRWKSQWDAHWLGKHGPISLKTYGVKNHDGKEVLRIPINIREPIVAAMGRVRLTLSTGVETLTFHKTNDGEPIVQTAKDGKEFRVTIDKNQIAAPYDQDTILALNNYDKAGRVLREWSSQKVVGPNTHIRCWGVIDHVKLTIRSGTIVKDIPYELKIGEGDEAAFTAFKNRVLRHREIADTMEVLNLALRKGRMKYGESIAGLYYVHTKPSGGKMTNHVLIDMSQADPGGEPMKLIPIELAHANPEGAATFGYEATPYKGYFFSLAKGEIRKGKPQPLSGARLGSYTWDGGEFKAKTYRQRQDFVATPVDKSGAHFISRYGTIYTRTGLTEPVEFIPEYDTLKEWDRMTPFAPQ